MQHNEVLDRTNNVIYKYFSSRQPEMLRSFNVYACIELEPLPMSILTELHHRMRRTEDDYQRSLQRTG